MGVRVESNKEGEGVEEKSKEGRVEEITKTVGEEEVETNIEGGLTRGIEKDKGEGVKHTERREEGINKEIEGETRNGNGTIERKKEPILIDLEEGAIGGRETQAPIPTKNFFSLLEIEENDEEEDETTDETDSGSATPNQDQTRTRIRITKKEKKLRQQERNRKKEEEEQMLEEVENLEKLINWTEDERDLEKIRKALATDTNKAVEDHGNEIENISQQARTLIDGKGVREKSSSPENENDKEHPNKRIAPRPTPTLAGTTFLRVVTRRNHPQNQSNPSPKPVDPPNQSKQKK